MSESTNNNDQITDGSGNKVSHLPDVVGSGDKKDEPWYEPEWCESCQEDCEQNGIEYEPLFDWVCGGWVCEHCGRPV